MYKQNLGPARVYAKGFKSTMNRTLGIRHMLLKSNLFMSLSELILFRNTDIHFSAWNENLLDILLNTFLPLTADKYMVDLTSFRSRSSSRLKPVCLRTPTVRSELCRSLYSNQNFGSRVALQRRLKIIIKVFTIEYLLSIADLPTKSSEC